MWKKEGCFMPTIETSKPYKVTSIRMNTKKLMDELGLSMKGLAKKANLQYNTVYLMLTKNASLTAINIKKIADVLGVEDEDLYDSVEEETNKKISKFGVKFRELSVQLEMSKTEMCRKSPYSSAYIYRMCTDTSICDTRKMRRIAESFGLDPTYFDDCVDLPLGKPNVTVTVDKNDTVDLSSLVDDEPLNITISGYSNVMVITTENQATVIIERMEKSIRITYTHDHHEWKNARYIGTMAERELCEFNIIDFCATNLRTLKINLTRELKCKIVEFSRFN